MEMNDLAAIGYASQMLAFAVLSALFLRRRTDGPFFRYLGVASAASSLAGGVLTLQALEFIRLGAIVALAEWVRAALWIVALSLDSCRRKLVRSCFCWMSWNSTMVGRLQTSDYCGAG